MTEEELEAEREAQIARGEMPRYGGQHAHLTEEPLTISLKVYVLSLGTRNLIDG
jgi:glutamyl/glutaminyl-tRNA synthetase